MVPPLAVPAQSMNRLPRSVRDHVAGYMPRTVTPASDCVPVLYTDTRVPHLLVDTAQGHVDFDTVWMHFSALACVRRRLRVDQVTLVVRRGGPPHRLWNIGRTLLFLTLEIRSITVVIHAEQDTAALAYLWNMLRLRGTTHLGLELRDSVAWMQPQLTELTDQEGGATPAPLLARGTSPT